MLKSQSLSGLRQHIQDWALYLFVLGGPLLFIALGVALVWLLRLRLTPQ